MCITVVIYVVANFCCTRMYGCICIIAIGIVGYITGRWCAIRYGSIVIPITITVCICIKSVKRINSSIAIVINAIADFYCCRIDGSIAVVAIGAVCYISIGYRTIGNKKTVACITESIVISISIYR